MKQKEANKEEKVKRKELKNEKLSLEKHKKLKEERNTYKQLSPETSKKLFINIILAVGIIAYFTILNYIYSEINQKSILNIVEICSCLLLIVGLVLLEISYKKDNGTTTIIGIEFLVLAFHSLSIKYVITRYDYQFQFYLLTSSYIFAIYYILKAIVVYTKARKEYLKTLSDIPEIVKKDEPIKKEAKKRSEEDIKVDKSDKIQQKPKSIRKRGTRKKKVEEISSENKEKNTRNKVKKSNQKTEKTNADVKKIKTTDNKKIKEKVADDKKIKTKKKSSKKEEEK